MTDSISYLRTSRRGGRWAPGCNLAARMNRAINDQPEHTAGRHLLSVVQAATNTERL